MKVIIRIDHEICTFTILLITRRDKAYCKEWVERYVRENVPDGEFKWHELDYSDTDVFTSVEILEYSKEIEND